MSRSSWTSLYRSLSNRRRRLQRRRSQRVNRVALVETLERRLLLDGAGDSSAVTEVKHVAACQPFPAVAGASVQVDQTASDQLFVSDNPEEQAFLRFDLSSFDADRYRATVQMVPTGTALAGTSHSLHIVGDDAWLVGSFDWNSRPALGVSALGSWTPQAEEPVNIDITEYVHRSLEVGDSLISVAIVASTGEGRVEYYGRGESLQPRLLLSPLSAVPEAQTDRYAIINDGTKLHVSAAQGLLANDLEVNCDQLSVAEVIQQPAHGIVEWQQDGSFVYTLTDIGFVGEDSFQYVVGDGTTEGTSAAVVIDVQQAMDIAIAPGERATVQNALVEATEEEEFVRFDLSKLGRQVFSARIRASSTSADTIHNVFDDTWIAALLTWETRPARSEEAVSHHTAHADGYVEFDVTALVKQSLEAGDEQISLALVGTPQELLLQGEGEFDEDLQLIITTSDVITVDTPLDDDDASQNYYSHTTLREAIQLANQTPEPEVIKFDWTGTPEIQLVSSRGQMDIQSDMVLLGPDDGSDLIITAPAGGNMRVFQVAAGTLVGMSDMMIRGGNLSSGLGGAIYNSGDLTLDRVTLTSNSASGGGGALYNDATGILTVSSSTLSGNTTGLEGGAIYNAGDLTVTRTTITNNTASTGGSGVRNLGTAEIGSTIIAGNASNTDVSGTFTSSGYNLIGNGTGASGFTGAGDLVGSSGSIINPLLGSLQDNGGAAWTHQLLPGSPAIDAGGTAASPVTDQRGAPRVLDGLDPGDPEDTVATADIGAYEFGTFVVNVAGDLVDSGSLGDGLVDVDWASGSQISLRAAIQELNALAGWHNTAGTTPGAMEGAIMFEVNASMLSLTRTGGNDDTAATGDLDIYGNMLIRGADATSGTYQPRISGGWTPWTFSYYPLEDRIFHVLPDAKLRVEGIRLEQGHAITNGGEDEGNGGLLLNDGGDVEISHSYFGESPSPSHLMFFQSASYNTAVRGGAIYTRGGSLVIEDSKVEGNEANFGGGIYVESGSVTVTSTNLEGNAALDADLGHGGGIYLQNGLLTVQSSSIVANELLGGDGGGLYIAGGTVDITDGTEITNNGGLGEVKGAGIFNQSTLSIKDSRVAFGHANAGYTGAGIYNTGSVSIVDSFIDDNGQGPGDQQTGGIYNDGGEVVMEGGSLSRNVSKEAGGAIYNNNGKVTLVGVDVSDNSAYLDGHAIFNFDLDARLTIINSTIANNIGQLNGTVSNQYGTVVVRDSTFSGNDTSMAGISVDGQGNPQLNGHGVVGFAGGAVHHRGENLALTSTKPLPVRLAASLNPQQTTLFLTDVDFFADLPLPFDILINEERMTVSAVDSFLDALTVHRGAASTIADEHSVVSDILLAGFLPVSDTSFIDHYSLPLDVVIENEVMTVTGVLAGSNVLQVERGRYGTKPAAHRGAMQIWGLGGSLTITGSTFSQNIVGAHMQFRHAPGSAVYSHLQPFVRPSVIENSTFFGNIATDGAAIAAVRSVYSLTGKEEEYDQAWTTLRDEEQWEAALVMQNSVVAGSIDPKASTLMEVMAEPLHSGGNNFIGVDQAIQLSVVEPQGIDAAQSMFKVVPTGRLPDVPFKVTALHYDAGITQREEMLVTAVSASGKVRTLTVQRGVDDTSPLYHPVESLLMVSQSGFWQQGDIHGTTLIRTVQERVAVNQPTGITATQTTVDVVDTSRFIGSRFPAELVHHVGSEVVSEAVFVTAVNGHTLTISRAKDGTTAVEHPSDSVLIFAGEFELKLDPLLGPLEDNGGPTKTHAPLPGSLLLDRGSEPLLTGQTITTASGLAGGFTKQSPLLMAVDPASHTLELSSLAFADEQVLQVEDASALPPAPFWLHLGNEILRATAVDVTGKLITVERGQLNTLPEQYPEGLTGTFGVSVGADANANTLYVLEVENLPPAPFLARVGPEIMRVTAVDLQKHQVTVQRGAVGTTISAHGTGTALEHGALLEVVQTNEFPEAPFVVQLGTELVQVSEVNHQHHYVIVDRGYYRSVPEEHVAGATGVFADGSSQGYHALSTALVSSITSTTETQIEVDTVPGLPTETPFDIRVADELLRVTAVGPEAGGTTTWTVQRGAQGSTPIPHTAGSTIIVLIDSRGARRLEDGNQDGTAQLDIGAVEAAIYTVNTLEDLPDLIPGNGRIDTGIAGQVSLRAAVEEGNASPGLITVILPQGDYAIDGELLITDATRIVGEGANLSLISACLGRAITVGAEARLQLIGLTVRDGATGQLGGGIYVDGGELQLDRVVVSGNSALEGGGIFNAGGTVVVTNSAVIGNSADIDGGGIASAGGQTIVRNSTVSGNQAAGGGGGVSTRGSVKLTLLNSTVTANSAAIGGGILAPAALDAATFGGSNGILRQNPYLAGFGDDFTPVDLTRSYELAGWARSGDGQGGLYNSVNRQYFGFATYDADKLFIQPYHVVKVSGAVDAHLAQELKPGDTQVVLDSAVGWYAGTTTHMRSLAWYGYQNSFGHTYPDYTYTRNVLLNLWDAGAISGNVITLRSPWSGPTVPAGAAVRNASSSGGTYNYAALVSGVVPDQWTQYSATISGVQQNGEWTYTKFRPGTAYIKPLMLFNYHGLADNRITWRDVTWHDTDAEPFQAEDTLSTIANTILAGNVSTTSGSDTADMWGAFSSLGHNLVGVKSAPALSLIDAIDTVETSLLVSYSGTLPRLPFSIFIDSEEMLVTQVDGEAWQVQRAQSGTTAASHAAGANLRFDGFWRSSDQTGTLAVPLNAQLAALDSSSSHVPVHPLAATSPAIESGDVALFAGPDLHLGTADWAALAYTGLTPPYPFPLARTQLRAVNWEALSAAPIEMELPLSGTDETVTASYIGNGVVRLAPRHNARSYPAGTAVTVLTDQRGAHRNFDADSNANRAMDIGAYELMPTVSIEATDAVKTEGDFGVTSFTFTVTRTGLTSGTTTVQYRVLPVAPKGVHANDLANSTVPLGPITFGPGETQKQIVIDVQGDTRLEKSEEFLVLLSAAPADVFLYQPSAVGTILNDDTAAITVSAVPADEGMPVVFELTLNEDVQAGFDLAWSTADGTGTLAGNDYTQASGRVSFAGIDGEVKKVVVYSTHDETVELSESVTLVLGAFSDADASITSSISKPSQVTGTIGNDDTATLKVLAIEQLEGDSGGASFVATVELSHAVDVPFTATLSSADGTATAGSDYQSFSTQVSFAGTAGETETVAFTVWGDSVLEGNETLALNLSGVSAAGRESSFSLTSGQATILNDDEPKIIVLDAKILEPGATSTLMAFDVVLTNPLGGPVSVDIATQSGTATSGSDFIAASTTLNFTGNDGEVKTFSVSIENDDTAEPDETFDVVLSNLQAGGNEAAFTLTGGQGTIENDDLAQLALEYIDRVETGFRFSVTLVGAVSAPFTVDVATFDVTATAGEGYQPVNQELNLTGASGQTHTVTVARLDGGDPEDVFGVRLSGLPAGINVAASPAQFKTHEKSRIEDPQNPGAPCLYEDMSSYSHDIQLIPLYLDLVTSGGPMRVYVKDSGEWPEGAQVVHDEGGNLWVRIEYGPYGIVEPGTSSAPSGGSVYGLQQQCEMGQDDEDHDPPDDPPPPPPTTPATIKADWVVAHSSPLTFNPFATFNYRLAQDVGVSVKNADGTFALVGQSIDLKFGKLTVNADSTLTYEPFANLPAQEGSDALIAEKDAAGNIVRFTRFEPFEAHMLAASAITAGGVPMVSTAFASAPIKLAVSNNLPVLRGDRIHAGAFQLDSPIFADFADAPSDPAHTLSYKIDLRDLFTDLDGVEALNTIEIKDIVYAGQSLDSSDPGPDPDGDPAELRIAIGAQQEMINGFPVDTTKKYLIVRKVNQYVIEIHNEVTQSDVLELWNNNYPSQLTLDVKITDGQMHEGKEHTWNLQLDVRPRNQSDHAYNWRVLTQAPVVDFRPWLREVLTPPFPDRYPNDQAPGPEPTLDPAAWRIASTQVSLASNSEPIAGADVDLLTGNFRLRHDLVLDGSGGTSEMALPGLIYDSSTVHVELAEGASEDYTALPVITAVVSRPVGVTASKIRADLTWYNSAGTGIGEYVNDSLDDSLSEYVIAVSPSEIDDTSGVYGWQLTITITTNSQETIVLRTSGETPVVVGDKNPMFGAGWALEGVPSLFLDTRDESDSVLANRSFDDRLVLSFPGAAPQIFNAKMLTLNDYIYNGELASLQPGSTEVSYDGFAAPLEFGRLSSRDYPEELVYDDGTGTEYIFWPYDTAEGRIYLINRIEQPNLDFDPDYPPTGRRGLSFTWGTYSPPTLSQITSTDGATTTFTYDAGILDKLQVVDAGVTLREVDFQIANGKLEVIRHRETPGSNSVDDRIRRFSDAAGGVNYAGRIATDKWEDNAGGVIRYRHFKYDAITGGVSQIQLGDGVGTNEHKLTYTIVSAASAVHDSTGNGLDDFKGTVTIAVPDLEKYDAPLSSPEPNSGSHKTEYAFTIEGRLARREEFFESTSLTKETWQYDHIGSVKVHTDQLGRQTFYWRDYEIPTGPTPTGSNDEQPKYDPDDYRGNVTYVYSQAGLTRYEYETDDETESKLGTLVKEVTRAAVNADPESDEKEAPEELTTLYKRLNDGRLESRRVVRGSLDPDPPTSVPLEDRDKLESWTYYDSGSPFEGYLQSYTDARGLKSEYTSYDGSRPETVLITDDFDGQVTQQDISYDAGHVDLVTTVDIASGQTISVQDYEYDSRGRLEQLEIRNGSGTVLSREKHEYAPDGLLTATLTYTTLTDAVRNEWHYDKAGLLTRSIAAAGIVSNGGSPTPAVSYSLYTGAAESVSQNTTYSYYADGSRRLMTLPGGYQEQYYYDYGSRAGWTVKTGIAKGGHSQSSGALQFGLSGEQTIENQLDSFGRHLQSKDHQVDLPVTSQHSAPTAPHARHQQTVAASGISVTTQTTRDALGRVALDEAPTEKVELKYDPLGRRTSTADLIGKRERSTQKTGPGGDVIEDRQNRTQENGGGWLTQYFTTQYIYDEQGRLRKTVDPLTDGPSGWEDEVGAVPARVDYAFDAGVGMTKVAHTSRAGVETFQWYDAAGRLVKELNEFGGVTQYTYDLAGNLIEQLHPAAGTNLPLRTTFQYDALGRLRATIQHTAEPFFTYTDYFLPGAAGADGWNEISFVPLAGNDPETASRPANIKDLAHRSRFDSQGNVYYIQQPDPTELSAGDTPTTLITYTYLPHLQDTVTTTRLSVADNVSALQSPSINASYEQQRLTREVRNALGQVTLEAQDLNPQTATVIENDHVLVSEPEEDGYSHFLTGWFVATARYEYHPTTGRLAWEIDGRGNATEHSYTPERQFETATDAKGKEWHTFYDSTGQMVKEVNGRGHATRRSYDALGRLVDVTDALGNEMLYTYENGGNRVVETNARQFSTITVITPAVLDSSGNLITNHFQTITNPDGDFRVVVFDKAGNVISRTDERGNQTLYEYDQLGRLTKQTEELGKITSYTYDFSGNLTSQTDALLRTTNYQYDVLNRQIVETGPDPTGPLPAPVIRYEYDASGNLLRQIEEAGSRPDRIQVYQYDGLDRVVQEEIVDSGGTAWSRTRRQYDAAGNLVELIQVTDVSANPDLTRVTQFEYDALNRKIAETALNPAGGDPLLQTRFTYDAAGNLEEVIEVTDFSTTPGTGRVTNYEYDKAGREIKETRPAPEAGQSSPVTEFVYDKVGNLTEFHAPDGEITFYGYDSLNRRTSQTTPMSFVTITAYDEVGNVESVTDPLGHTTTYLYDELDRLERVTDHLQHVTQYTYDAVGNRKTVIDPELNTTTWNYDELNRLTSEVNQLGDSRSFEYDEYGNLVKRTDREGRVTSYEHDLLGRLEHEKWLDDLGAIIHTISFTYDDTGVMLTASDPNATLTYQPDGMGRVSSITYDVGLGFNVTLSQQYDVVGDRDRLEAQIGGVPDFITDFGFDHLHRLTLVQQTAATGATRPVRDKMVTLHYDSTDHLSDIYRYEFVGGTSLVAHSHYVLDSDYRLTYLDHKDGAANLLTGYGWIYDDANRVTQFNSSVDGTASYAYDDTNQLTGETYVADPQVPAPLPADAGYQYDDNGNRTGGGYQQAANNRATSDGTFNYEYDQEGNRTSRTRIATGERDEYTWDHRNRLVKIVSKDSGGSVLKTIDYAYDHLNRRVAKTITPAVGPAEVEHFIYDDQHIALRFENLNLASRYLHGAVVDQVLADEQLDTVAGTSDILWPLADNLGTVRDVAEFDEATGITSIANHLTYGAFGQVASETDAAIEHLFGFTGRERDEESGLHYYRARYYDPQLGQFLSEDPIGFEAGDPNLRRYVGNNATNATDPSGLQELDGESLAQQRRQLKAKVRGWIQSGASRQERAEFLDGLKEGFLDGLKDWLAIAALAVDAAIVTDDKRDLASWFERLTDLKIPGRGAHRESVRAAELRMAERLDALERLGVELSQVREVTQRMVPVAAEVLSIVGANLPPSVRAGALATFDRGKSTAQLATQAEQIIEQASPLLVQIASAAVDAGPRALGYIAGAVLYEVTETLVIGAVTGPAGAAARVTVSHAKIALKVAQKYPKIGNLASTVIEAGKIADASPMDEATRLASRGPTAGGLNRMNPRDIRFTQDTVSPNFSNGGTLTDAVNKLIRGERSADDFPPIRVVEYKGKLYSLDNRRLSAFKAAQLDDIPVQRLDLSDPAVKAEFLKKFRPINDGLNNVVVPSKGRAEARRILREFGKYDSN